MDMQIAIYIVPISLCMLDHFVCFFVILLIFSKLTIKNISEIRSVSISLIELEGKNCCKLYLTSRHLRALIIKHRTCITLA